MAEETIAGTEEDGWNDTAASAAVSSIENPETNAAIEAFNQRLNGSNGTLKKLYGRESEQDAIYQVYQRVKEDSGSSGDARKTEFILIEGSTGTGKTALAQQFLAPLVRKDAGYCILGKFDQLVQLQKPHSAFVEALTAYAMNVQERDAGDVERVRRALADSVDTNDARNTLLNMVPSLAKVFDQPEEQAKAANGTEKMGNNQRSSINLGGYSSYEASNQCKYALSFFLRAICSPEIHWC